MQGVSMGRGIEVIGAEGSERDGRKPGNVPEEDDETGVRKRITPDEPA